MINEKDVAGLLNELFSLQRLVDCLIQQITDYYINCQMKSIKKVIGKRISGTDQLISQSNK